jgi:hypothetical protein
MNPQVASESKSQAFATTTHHHDALGGTRGASLARYDNCKKEGHVQSGCWFLYPVLRPKRRDKGDDQRGSHRDEGDHTEQRRRNGGLSATLEDPTQID